MAHYKLKLYDSLYYDIFVHITNWIQTNDINYDIIRYRKLGYFPNYNRKNRDKNSSNLLSFSFSLRWYLFHPKLENKINDKVNPFPLAILEDEKLSVIHKKIIAWYETHRLYSEFNNPAPNRKRCYRPTQYKNAKRCLWRKLRKELFECEKVTPSTKM